MKEIFVAELPKSCDDCDFYNAETEIDCGFCRITDFTRPAFTNDETGEIENYPYCDCCPLRSLAKHDKEHDQAFETVKKLGEEWKHRAEVAERQLELAIKELRDNAYQPCRVCKKYVGNRCILEPKDCAGFYHWEWRGEAELKGGEK